ncbi:MAG: GldG family protein [Candidatus Marinimicrobia bacterium]|nr:GldG family protein [Candidatus Neomarinimicrobiota bacterium]
MTQIHNKKQFITYILLILAIIVIFNIALRSLFFRVDLTRENVYSLSHSSKTVIRKLDDRMIARVFYSDNLPGQYANSRRYLQDLLEEYQAYSKGRFHFEFINPDEDQDAMREAQSYQIPPIQLQVIENDKLEVKKVYMGLVLLYNDKKETLPVIQSTTGVEYDLTAAIKKLTAVGMNTIGVYTGNTSIKTEQLEEILRQTYNVRNVGLENEIPTDITTLLVNGVTDSLSEEELFNLDQYLMRGGKLFLGVSRIDAQLQQGIGNELKTNFYDFLAHYGILVGRDLLIDKRCGQIQIQQKQGFFSFSSAINYPPFILVQKFNEDHIIVKDLEETRLFFTNAINSSKGDDSFIPLMKTSERTGLITPGQVPQMMYGQYTMAEGYNIMPDIKNSPQYTNPAMNNFSEPSQTIAGLFQGGFTSFFADSSDQNSKETFIGSINDGQIIVVGDNEFLNDQAAGGIESNLNFIINSIDYLSGDQELIDIRSRTVTSRPLDELSKSSRTFWKWLNILLPSVLVIFYGLFRMRQNKAKRKMMEEIYGR